MEKEVIKNRQTTEMNLIKAVDELIEENGFEGYLHQKITSVNGTNTILG